MRASTAARPCSMLRSAAVIATWVSTETMRVYSISPTVRRAARSRPCRRSTRYTSSSTTVGVTTSARSARCSEQRAASGPSVTTSSQTDESRTFTRASEPVGLVAIALVGRALGDTPKVGDRLLRHKGDHVAAIDEAHDLPGLQVQALADLLGDDDLELG